MKKNKSTKQVVKEFKWIIINRTKLEDLIKDLQQRFNLINY